MVSELVLSETANERKHFSELEQTYRATLNMLEDFDEERNKLIGVQAALMNILEDIEAERFKTEQANKLLEVVNKELEAFSYSVSHDLRAPLRAVSGFAQVLMEDFAPDLDEDGKRYLNLIQANAHRMGKLIDDLLAFSRLGRQQIMEITINMESMAWDVFKDLAALTPQRKINFSVSSVPFARGDKAMVQQVLMNLLSNAIKFTKNRTGALIEFGYQRDLGQGAYYVKDNGVGFDMKYYNKLFGVFQRLHSPAEFEGTGVGLALVHRIVTRHGGRVWAEGQIDQGATFFFTLP